MRIKTKRAFCILGTTAALLATDNSATGLEIPSHRTDNGGRGRAPSSSSGISPEELAITQGTFADYAFTSSLRDNALQQSQRYLIEGDDTCLASGSTCNQNDNTPSSSSSSSSSCCQGGCNSNKQCYCQPNNGLCFNLNSQNDAFCCSNMCGEDGRCRCIRQGESCHRHHRAGSNEEESGYCCDGLTCGEDGMCVLGNSNDGIGILEIEEEEQQQQTSNDGIGLLLEVEAEEDDQQEQQQSEKKQEVPVLRANGFFGLIDFGIIDDDDAFTTSSQQQLTPNPTKRPTKRPTNRPTRRPTKRPTKRPTTSTTTNTSSNTNNNRCQRDYRVCFNRGHYDLFCCSGQCGSNGRCSRSSTSSPMSRPTKRPSTRPSKRPTKRPTSVPTNAPTTSDPTREPSKQPTTKPTAPPEPTTTTASSVSSSTSSNSNNNFIDIDWDAGTTTTACDDPTHYRIEIEIKTDQFGGDTAWSLREHIPPSSHSNNNTNTTNNEGAIIASVPANTYTLFTLDTFTQCIPPGLYNFTITDQYGDGICCAYGDGYIKIRIDDREILHVKSYGHGMSELLHVGYNPSPQMSERDYLWLEAHNHRRLMWFRGNGLEQVPLQWSPMLAEESRVWAEKLLVNCSGAGIEHEKGVREGENLAKNTGTVNAQGGGWGQLYPPTKIVGRWVEFEVDRPYPGNAHLTQALWRPAKYMGCGESVRDFRNGVCRVQVCRYARAGNCDMARFNSTFGRNWLPPMLADTSRCGPNCAPEGCF